jgi:hypothetical protein
MVINAPQIPPMAYPGFFWVIDHKIYKAPLKGEAYNHHLGDDDSSIVVSAF